MIFEETQLEGLMVVRTRPIADARGRFVRVFCEEEFSSALPPNRWRQTNISYTSGRGAIRGMHFQHPPASEAKLVRCLRGRVFDVAIDIRSNSPTFLHWQGIELSPENETMLFIPEGFAHGFQVLDDEAELLYMHSASYSPQHDGRLRFDEPRVGISWPLPPGAVSKRDLDTLHLDSTFIGLSL